MGVGWALWGWGLPFLRTQWVFCCIPSVPQLLLKTGYFWNFLEAGTCARAHRSSTEVSLIHGPPQISRKGEVCGDFVLGPSGPRAPLEEEGLRPWRRGGSGGMNSAWGPGLVGFLAEVQSDLQESLRGRGDWAEQPGGNLRLRHRCDNMVSRSGPERGKCPGPLCLEASGVFHFTEKEHLLAEAAAPNALQPSMVLCGKEGPFPPQGGRARPGPHCPRMQLAQGASLAPRHKCIEFASRGS